MSEPPEYLPPFYVIPMPVDAEGRGPIFDKSRVVKTYWEVWDQCYLAESSHDTREEAEARAEELNNPKEKS